MYNYEYEPTPMDAEIFLSDEPVNLIKEHIRSQFEDPLGNQFDYVGSFIEKFNASVLDVETDDEDDDLERIHDDFMTFMLSMFSDKLDVDFPDFDLKSYEDQNELIHITYRYFIINIKHNFSSFCSHHIDMNQKSIVESLPKKKDVTYLNLKKDGIDTDDNIIISNLFDIICNYIGEDHDIDDFMNLSDWKEPRLETEMIKEWFDEFQIVGNFYPKYRLMIDNSFAKEIESKVRNRILKKYKKNKNQEE